MSKNSEINPSEPKPSTSKAPMFKPTTKNESADKNLPEFKLPTPLLETIGEDEELKLVERRTVKKNQKLDKIVEMKEIEDGDEEEVIFVDEVILVSDDSMDKFYISDSALGLDLEKNETNQSDEIEIAEDVVTTLQELHNKEDEIKITETEINDLSDSALGIDLQKHTESVETEPKKDENETNQFDENETNQSDENETNQSDGIEIGEDIVTTLEELHSMEEIAIKRSEDHVQIKNAEPEEEKTENVEIIEAEADINVRESIQIIEIICTEEEILREDQEVQQKELQDHSIQGENEENKENENVVKIGESEENVNLEEEIQVYEVECSEDEILQEAGGVQMKNPQDYSVEANINKNNCAAKNEIQDDEYEDEEDISMEESEPYEDEEDINIEESESVEEEKPELIEEEEDDTLVEEADDDDSTIEANEIVSEEEEDITGFEESDGDSAIGEGEQTTTTEESEVTTVIEVSRSDEITVIEVGENDTSIEDDIFDEEDVPLIDEIDTNAVSEETEDNDQQDDQIYVSDNIKQNEVIQQDEQMDVSEDIKQNEVIQENEQMDISEDFKQNEVIEDEQMDISDNIEQNEIEGAQKNEEVDELEKIINESKNNGDSIDKNKNVQEVKEFEFVDIPLDTVHFEYEGSDIDETVYEEEDPFYFWEKRE